MQALYLFSNIEEMGLMLLAVSILVGQCVFCQMVLSTWQVQYRRRTFLEWAAIFFVFVLCLVVLAANQQVTIGLPATTKYQGLRYISCIFVLAHLPLWRHARCGMWYLAVGAVAGLPLLDILAPWNLIVALLLVAVRIVVGIPKVWQRIRQELRMGSIKEAMDTLPVGILFAKPDGEVLLANTAMLYFMDQHFGEQYRDANHLWQKLRTMEPTQMLKKIYVGDQLLFRIEKEGSFLVSREILQKKKRQYQQITVMDVTEEDRSAIELAEQQQILKEQSNRLRYILANLEAYQRQQVLTEVASQIHDLLGQRITILQQILNNKRFTDYVSMIPLVNTLIRDMRENIQENPREILNTIIDTYSSIGVSINITGSLPAEYILARVFVSIIREGATNAVRHGHANVVSVHIEKQDDMQVLTITDNGIPPEETITFGTGLKGIRNKVERLGGLLVVKAQPQFTMVVEINESVIKQGKKAEKHDD